MIICPECGGEGYLEKHHRGRNRNTYLYVAHPYHITLPDGRKVRRVRKCYLGPEGQYKHLESKYRLGLSSPYTMSPPKLLVALERLLTIIDMKTTGDASSRRNVAEILERYARVFRTL